MEGFLRKQKGNLEEGAEARGHLSCGTGFPLNLSKVFAFKKRTSPCCK